MLTGSQSRIARPIAVVATAAAHLSLLSLLMSERAVTWQLVPPKTPAMATWNILAPTNAPPAATVSALKTRPVTADIDAPLIEIAEPVFAESGTGGSLPADPYAGASPVRPGYAPSVVAAQLVSAAAAVRSSVSQAVDPDPASPFTHWMVNLRSTLGPALHASPAALRAARAEVLAQPSGGFTSARITGTCGDVALDRLILVDLMQHTELIKPGWVDQPRWFSLPPIDVVETSR